MKPSVLFIVNVPDWAHDRKTDSLARNLAGRWEVRKRFHADVTADDVMSADLVALYYWLQLGSLPGVAEALRARRDRLLVGICSHYELEGAHFEPGVALLSGLPRAVFANNLGLIRRFEPLLGRSVFYTPNGVDSSYFVPGDTVRGGGTLRVGWAGSLENHGLGHRGVHDVIVPAVARLRGAEVVLAAREERWRNREEMLAFYRTLDVYVCASRSDGTPNPCLEAAACGVPLVTTPVGNMPEFVVDGENGFFFDRTVDDLVSKLRVLRDEPSRRRRMGEAARASAERWDWSRQALAYDAMFREVLSTET